MLIDLSDLLSKEGNPETFQASLEMKTFKFSGGEYPIVKAEPFSITVSATGRRKVSIHAAVKVTLAVPCDRCLRDVMTDIGFSIDSEAAADASDSDKTEADGQNFMEGSCLDVDMLVYPEILINLPSKILCKEDCLGLCPCCGADLNNGDCGCDRSSPDPRMSVIKDIFNNRKEVTNDVNLSEE